MARPLILTKATLNPDRTYKLEIALQEPRPSASGKTLLVATESGGTGQKDPSAGREVVANLNAYVYPAERVNPASPLRSSKAALKGKTLTITGTLAEPRPSGSGKSMIVATDSGGTGVKLGGKEIMLTFSMYFYPDDKK